MSVDPLVAAFQDDVRKLQQQLADAHKDFLEAINASSAVEYRLQQQLADARQENERLREVGEKILDKWSHAQISGVGFPLIYELEAALRTEQGDQYGGSVQNASNESDQQTLSAEQREGE